MSFTSKTFQISVSQSSEKHVNTAALQTELALRWEKADILHAYVLIRGLT